MTGYEYPTMASAPGVVYTPLNSIEEVCPMSTFYHGDCLFVMNHDIPLESIDLIYLDPPFFTGKVQKGIWRPEAMEISFDDSKRFWSAYQEQMRGTAPDWIKHLSLKRPDFASYLYYMMVRLEACHRVLKSTGSIYLHCDPRASHYLKMVMDEIFGWQTLRNEVIWSYRSGGGSKRHNGRKHDILFWYSKSKNYYFDPNAVRIPYSAAISKSRESLFDLRGKVSGDVWDISRPPNHSPEWVGYPTQKPEVLLERIITAHSKEDSVILDPFCGCGTTVIVASRLNREWIGIDIDTSPRELGKLPKAFEVISNRSHSLFQQAKYITRDISEVAEMNGLAFEAWVNEFYKATKPSPDRGVDGITQDGTPIQAKTFQIKYNVLSQFVTDAKYHPLVPQPVKQVLAVSQTGFDDSARQRKFEIEMAEGIKVTLMTPEEMLKIEGDT